MSEHRRKPPQPQGGGRAAARRGTPGAPSGRRAAPRGDTESPSASYGGPGPGSGAPDDGDRPYGGRAEARRAAQRSGSVGAGGGRRRAPDGGGRAGGGGGRRGGGSGGPGPGGAGRGRGRGAEPPRKKRFIDYPRAGKVGARRWLPSWRLVTGVFLGFFGGLMAVAGISYALVEVPEVDKAAKAQNNVYYWADGKQMVATGGERNRQIIDYDDIPKEMRFAVMSAENKSFEKDKGVDPMGITRALVNMAKGGQTQGGSTITQQYVKNARLGDQSQTFTRKFKELFISIKVGRTVSKEDIMAGYLNTAYYGRGAYGIQAAARAYFNEEASRLDPSQCAFLATVLKGATYYDPAGYPEIDPAANKQDNSARAKKRWKWILDEEVKDGHLTSEQRAKYTAFPKLQNPRSNMDLAGQTGYLVDLAKAYVIRNTNITAEQLQRGGYEIHTTFERKKVKELEDAVNKVRKERIKPKVRPEKDTHVQFGGASVDPKDGAIKAIYGGEDATKHFTNNADQTGAQVGSTYKPFVLAAAFKYGVRDPDGPEEQTESERTIVNPKSRYSGKNELKIQKYNGQVWTDRDGKQWNQKNDGNQSYNRPTFQIDLREAMRESVNSAYVQLGMDVGLEKVKQAAMDAGLKDDDSMAGATYPSFSLGTSSPSAIRMAGAYSTFAASGKQNEPYSVTEVKHEGDTVFRHENKPKQAFNAEVADNVTDVLRTVVDKGTGTSAQLTGRQVAGKTGTTDGNKSAWFVGYTPQLSTAVSMYRLDDDETNKKRKFLEMFGTGGEEKIHGASFPAQIWQDYMEEALKGKAVVNFPVPGPIGKVVGETPPPPPTPTKTEEPEETTSPTPTESKTTKPPSESPDPGESCDPFDWDCNHDGGQENGGADGGVDGGPGGESPPPTEDPVGGGANSGNGNGNGGGGIFGGPSG
ncbi:transglycosylase domain-containing protein [Streptomyces sp. Je 1-369]|uniref:transglycosylase domain-containing protein n=1 Tax=Streptomyces sp. Je 1-369 TaxID=2966192 RepID=UPI0022858445|nr:transglycosylase domain-containing protein [Streptomyces sp. Je 1-369]WAL96612.1 penicillin-binding protein [Streptomyces sp. Je 1-369]